MVTLPLRLAWGLTLLLVPDRLVVLAGDRPDAATRITLQVLGARHLGQAVVQWRWPVPATRRLGAAADAVHGCTAAVLAVVDRRQRRVAAADAAVARSWAAAACRSAPKRSRVGHAHKNRSASAVSLGRRRACVHSGGGRGVRSSG